MCTCFACYCCRKGTNKVDAAYKIFHIYMCVCIETWMYEKHTLWKKTLWKNNSITDFLHCNEKVNIVEFGTSFSIVPCKKPDLNLIQKWFSNCVSYEEKLIKKGSAWTSRVIPGIDINFQSSCIIILASLKKWHIHLKRKMILIFLISSSLVNTHGAELQQRHISR